MFRYALISALGLVAVQSPAHAVAFKMTDAIVTAGTQKKVMTDPGLRDDQQMVAAFDGQDRLVADAAQSSGFGYYTGAHSGVAFAPAGDRSTYAAIGAGGKMVFDLRDITDAAHQLASVSVYLGSIDVYNFIDILGVDADGAVDYDSPMMTMSGADLIGAAGGHPNGRVTFGFGDADRVGAIRFRSTGVAFEFDSIGVSTMLTAGPTLGAGAVPEPASWAMMLGGFGMVGGALRKRKWTVRFA